MDRRLVVTASGSDRIAAIFDERLDAALAYKLKDRELSVRDGKVVDQRGVSWDVWGRSTRGEQLEFVPSFEVMRFGWYAFFPQSTVAGDAASPPA